MNGNDTAKSPSLQFAKGTNRLARHTIIAAAKVDVRAPRMALDRSAMANALEVLAARRRA
jgi:hypothetical protein